MDQLGEPIHGFFLFCFLFDLPRRASNHLRKGPIYHDLLSKAVVMPASVNPFCPPQKIFCVVVSDTRKLAGLWLCLAMCHPRLRIRPKNLPFSIEKIMLNVHDKLQSKNINLQEYSALINPANRTRQPIIVPIEIESMKYMCSYNLLTNLLGKSVQISTYHHIEAHKPIILH